MTDPALVLQGSVRSVLVALAGLLNDIVLETLDREEDMAVVAEAPDGPTLRRVLRGTPADLVIWRLTTTGDAGRLDPDLFAEHPSLKVLTVEDDGRHGSLWAMRPCSAALGELSPRLLVDTIRRLVVT